MVYRDDIKGRIFYGQTNHWLFKGRTPVVYRYWVIETFGVTTNIYNDR